MPVSSRDIPTPSPSSAADPTGRFASAGGPVSGVVANGADTRQPNLKARTAKASAWRVVAYGLGKLIQVGSNVIIARLLTKDDFGLMTLVAVVLQSLKMFTDLGIGPAIVQSRHSHDERFLNTGWTLQCGRGILIWVVGCILAIPAANYFQQPLLAQIIPVIGLSNLITGFNSTSVFTQNRQLAEGRRVILETVQTIVTRGGTILLAFYTRSVWSFIYAAVLGTLVYTIGTHVWLPGPRNRFCLDRGAIKALTRFGTWIFIGTVIAFFAQQADKLILGKLGPDESTRMATLGVYNISLTISKLPQEFTGVLLVSVLYPLMAELARKNADSYGNTVLRVRALMFPPAIVLILGMVLASPWFFDIFYKPEYADAKWMAPLGALAVWVGILDQTSNKMLLAIAATRPLAFAAVFDLIGTVAACLVGYHLYGMPGFVVGTAAGAAIGYIYMQVSMARKGIPVHWQDLQYTSLLLVLSAIGVGGEILAHQLVHERLWIDVACIAWTIVVTGATGLWALWRILPVVRKRA